jgi:hypothetical protein
MLHWSFSLAYFGHHISNEKHLQVLIKNILHGPAYTMLPLVPRLNVLELIFQKHSNVHPVN